MEVWKVTEHREGQDNIVTLHRNVTCAKRYVRVQQTLALRKAMALMMKLGATKNTIEVKSNTLVSKSQHMVDLASKYTYEKIGVFNMTENEAAEQLGEDFQDVWNKEGNKKYAYPYDDSGKYNHPSVRGE